VKANVLKRTAVARIEKKSTEEKTKSLPREEVRQAS
jgi:hypothetical protein